MPNVPVLDEPEHRPQGWAQSNFDRLLKHVRQLNGKVGRYESRHFWLALILTIVDSGERVTSVRELRCCDVDVIGRSLHFDRRYRWTAGADNKVNMPARTMKAIEKLQMVDGRPVMTGLVID